MATTSQTWPNASSQSAREAHPWRKVRNFRVRINDEANFRVMYKDIFEKRIYHFDAKRPDPLILDCGSNIGLSVLYFKSQLPGARIVAFEPDPIVAELLRENLAVNGVEDVTVVEAALAGQGTGRTLHCDGLYASSLVTRAAADHNANLTAREVACVRLADYVKERVDFLKLNVEGAEWDVLSDSEALLGHVDAMVLEYHHLPGLPRRLHDILALLDRRGFEYLIHSFDETTNPHAQPPFRLRASTKYYLLIYARRKD